MIGPFYPVPQTRIESLLELLSKRFEHVRQRLLLKGLHFEAIALRRRKARGTERAEVR